MGPILHRNELSPFAMKSLFVRISRTSHSFKPAEMSVFFVRQMSDSGRTETIDKQDGPLAVIATRLLLERARAYATIYNPGALPKTLKGGRK